MSIKLIYLCLQTFWSSMNKIKFLKFDSVCLITVYPPTAILENNYEICGGESADILPQLVFLRIAFTKLFTSCRSVRRQETTKPMLRRLLNIFVQNNNEKIGAVLSFEKIDTRNSRFKRRSLHITVIFIHRRPTHLPILREKWFSFYFRYRNKFLL